MTRSAPGRAAIAAIVVVLAGCSAEQTSAESAGDPSPTSSPAAVSTSSTDPASTDPASTDPASADAASADTGATPTESPIGGDGCPLQEPGSRQIIVTVESTTYPVQVYVPSSYGSEPVPAVLNWHGLGSTGPQQAFLTDYESLAEQEGFLVAHPTGMTTQISGDAKGWELDQFDVPGRDDVAMAAALIDRLIAEYCADPQRVYSTGMSNGGFFTSRLVCELSDRIAAAVSVAGVSHHDDCSPTRAVPFMAFHGTDDTVVPFAGGVSTLLGNDPPPELTAFFDQVMPDEFAEFSTDFGCSSEPVVTNVTAEVVSYDYQGCDNGVAMSFVEVVGGGHTWPGSPLGPVMEAFVGLTTDDVSATVDGWTFMSRFTLPE